MTSRVTLTPFPTIPDDITRLILEAVVEDDRRAALSLVFVARDVQKWCVILILSSCSVDSISRIQPLLFRIVRLVDDHRAESFLQTVLSNPRLAYHVRNLALRFGLAGLAEAIIPCLPNLQMFAVWVPVAPIASEDLMFMGLEAFRHRINSVAIPLEIMPLLPSSLTHLQLYGRIHPLELQKGLKQLPRLSHLLIYPWPPETNNVRPFLEEFHLDMPKSLQQILVALGPFDSSSIAELTLPWFIERCDHRVVIVILRRIPGDFQCIVLDPLQLSPTLDLPVSLDIWDKATEVQNKLAARRLMGI